MNTMCLFRRVLGLALVVAFAPVLRAQINRGAIEGVVTDPQGAVVPGVKVTITSQERNLSVTTNTTAAGYYRVFDLVPGKYSARCAVTGFSPLDITGVEVAAAGTVRTDAQLKLGPSEQSIQVTAQTPLIQTDASNFSTSLGAHTIQDIPLQGRDLQQLIFLLPGVNSAAGPPGSNFGFNSQYGTFPDPTHVLGSDLSANGGQRGANGWYLDGNLNLSANAENIVVNPSPDAVQEFQAITNAFSAEYSRTGGAFFNVVLKSGANDFHGNIYEFNRNDATNARNPFTSIDSSGNLIKDRQLRYNNFGGTLGGPVILPGLYNGKNKTFFFFSGDFTILHLLGNKVFTVPTPSMRQGDFSEDANTVAHGIWDPYSTIGPDPQTGLFQRTAFGTPVPGNPFGANGCLNTAVEAGATQGIQTCNFATQIPNNRLDPTAMFFVKSFPLPNYVDPLSGCPPAQGGRYRLCNNYLGAVGSSQDPRNISIKIDHRWSDKSSYFGEWLYNPVKYSNYRVPWTGPTMPWDESGWGGQYPIDLTNQIIALGNTYSVSPTLVNEFRVSFSRQFITTNPEQAGYPDSITNQSQVLQLLAPLRIPSDTSATPYFYMSSPGGGGIQFGPTVYANMRTATEAYTILDNVTKIIGKHTLKSGFMYRLEHAAVYRTFPTVFGPSGALVQDPSTGLGGGSSLAQFMLGAMGDSGSDISGKGFKPYTRFRSWGFYFQDDFHVTPNFTLNLGVRWDIFGNFRTRQHPFNNFCFTCPNSDTGLPGKVIYEGDPEWPAKGHVGDVYPPHWNSIGPRINFSWSPFGNRKTVIRGGYDIFYSNGAALANSPGQNAPNASGWNVTTSWVGSFYPDKCKPFTGQCVAFPLSDTTTDKATLGSPPLTSETPAQQHSQLYGYSPINAWLKTPRDPMVQSWNLQIQRELPGNMMISVGYVGTHGTHLLGDPYRAVNYIQTADKIKYKAAINAYVPITDYYSGQTATRLEQVWGSPTLPRSLLLNGYPFWGTEYVAAYNYGDGTSIYHALNVKIEKRFSDGLSFLAAYTNSKEIDNPTVGYLGSLTVDPFHSARTGNLGGRGGTLQSTCNCNKGVAFQDIDNRNADRAIAANDIPQIFNLATTYELPVGKGKRFVNNKGGIVNGIVGGWKLTTIFHAEGGVPLPIFCPSNNLTSRCNLIGDPKAVPGGQNATNWINPAAFEPAFGSDQSFWQNPDFNDPRMWSFGNAGLRLPGIRSPGFWNLDAALAKDFHVTESKYFTFRWEVFNALNHQNLGFPNNSFCLPPGAGGETDSVHQAGCQFGRITNIQTDPRSMQFALKFSW